jgi:hypothetical protein
MTRYILHILQAYITFNAITVITANQMAWFTNAEYGDTHFMHPIYNGNANAIKRIPWSKFGSMATQ